MPRIKRNVEEPPRPTSGDLAQRLADELRSNHEFGQPVINEQVFPNGKLRVTVIWDDWDRLSLENRTAVILHAYHSVEGASYRERIALASGLTVPEAVSAGMLPFEVLPALRREDQVTLENCYKAMRDVGGSILLGCDRPRLRFPSQTDAEAARRRLIASVPKSDEVWVITQEVGKVEDWISA